MPLPPADRTILIYEYLTGGGLYSEGPVGLPVASLLAEGAAMVRALTADFAQIERCQVHALCDARQRDLNLGHCARHLIHNGAEELQVLKHWSSRSDWTVVIAPETGYALSRRIEVVEKAGGRLLGPGAKWVQVASHKTDTAERLAAAGVATPRLLRSLGDAIYPDDYPLIIKPVDGAGCLGLQRLDLPAPDHPAAKTPGQWHIESWVAGLPVSVSLLCRDEETIVLPAGQQCFSEGVHGHYLGGRMPLSQPWRGRAERLAQEAMRALPGARGFVGVDLILGNDQDGSLDVVLEVNPRLTTSYVGLRELLDQNLAELMLCLVEGRRCDMVLPLRGVEFDADGTTRCLPGSPLLPV
ncbi:MAG: ATP-grasp domain-containing protein [Planctomycetota bacterium]|nr:ATP-grasp domain-containing protein [Planctomycetota bacterium]